MLKPISEASGIHAADRPAADSPPVHTVQVVKQYCPNCGQPPYSGPTEQYPGRCTLCGHIEPILIMSCPA